MGADGRRLSVLQAAALLVGLLVPAAPAAAAEPSFELLDEPFSVARVIDLDRDGARDLAVLTADPTVQVQWWTVASGDLQLVASLQLFDDPPSFDTVSLRPVEWAGRPRLLLVLGETAGDMGQHCCMVMYWIDADGLRLAATPITGSLPDGLEAVIAFDADDDGTDELLAISGVYAENQDDRPVQLLRLEGDRVAPVGAPVQITTDTGWSPPGDSDGLRGAEVVFGPDGKGELVRIGTDSAGALRTDTTELPELAPAEGDGGWVVDAGDGRLLIQTDGGLSIVTWPFGGAAHIAASRQDLWAIGLPIRQRDGSSVVAAHSGDGPAALITVGPALEELGRTPFPDTSDAWWSLAERHAGLRQVEPQYPAWGYVGPLAGGGTGWMIEGSLMRIGDEGSPEKLVAGGLAGIAPVGSMGPDDGWLVLVYRSWGFSEFEALRLVPEDGTGGLVVVPLEELVRPTAEPDVRLGDGAVAVRHGWAAVAEPAISFEVEAPVGSRVVALLNGRVELDVRSERGTTEVTMQPTRRQADDPEMEALVVVTTPLGRTGVAEWTVDVMREPPRLEASDETATAALASMVRGTTEPGATVTVDGRPVEVAGDGSFSVRVDASPWPRDLRVVATSIVGRESVAVLSVVGLFDWRPVPWQVGMALLTVAVGVALFVTAGHRRPPPRTALAGEGEWVEFEGPISDVAWVEPAVPSARPARGTAPTQGDEWIE